MSVYPSIYLPTHPSITCPSVHLCFHLQIHPPTHPLPVHSPTYLVAHLGILTPTHPLLTPPLSPPLVLLRQAGCQQLGKLLVSQSALGGPGVPEMSIHQQEELPHKRR